MQVAHSQPVNFCASTQRNSLVARRQIGFQDDVWWVLPKPMMTDSPGAHEVSVFSPRNALLNSPPYKDRDTEGVLVLQMAKDSAHALNSLPLRPGPAGDDGDFSFRDIHSLVE